MERYSRHFNLPGFTRETQIELKRKKIAVIGAGGLGSPVLHYLVAAGVGSIHIIDDDAISLTNLQRQVIFTEEQIGLLKADSAKSNLKRLNSEVLLNASNEKISEQSINQLLDKNLDLIIDASDNFECRYLVDSYSNTHGIPLIYGAIHRYEGQVCVFNYKGSSSYRDLFPIPPEDGVVDNCDINGVLGPVAGVIGSLMATEALKILTGIGKVQSDELVVLRFDDLAMVKMKIPKKKGRMDQQKENKNTYHSISSEELKEAIVKHDKIHLIDVRNEKDYSQQHIDGAINIPYSALLNRIDDIPREQKVVLICNIGQVSINVLRFLQNEYDYTNLVNLTGGINAFFEGEEKKHS
jgi:adenylyltransferase/sulfurtransferase